MRFRMRLLVVGALLVCVGLSACVSVDPGAVVSSVDRQKSANFSVNVLTDGRQGYSLWGVGGETNLARLVGHPLRWNSDFVNVNYSSKSSLVFSFHLDGKVAETVTIRAEDGLIVNPDGSLLIKNGKECTASGGSAGGAGCFGGNSSLFINSKGDLASIQTIAGAGAELFVIPSAGYVRKLVVFQRLNWVP